MSSTSGTSYYTSRTMNGINQISVINENITDLENKTQDITYNDLTDTTTIVNNTQFYNTTINTSLTASNVKLTDNSIDMSNNGTYTFIDDGLSAQVVDTIHNQTIGGSKTFTGSVDIDTLIINSTTYPDGSTQTSANYLTPIQVNATDRITATNSMETNQLTAVDIYCETINITDKIIDANDTGTTPKSFIYNATTMAYKDPIVNNTPLVVAVGDRVKSNGIGLQPFGDAGLQIASINTTNRIITFNPAGNFSLTNPSAALVNNLCAITSTSTFTSYIASGGYVNYGIRGTGTSNNQPFLNAIVSPYNYNTPTASLTYTPDTTKTGYINSSFRLVSLNSYTNQNFISMTGTSNPAYISATFGTNDYTISSQNTITPNTITGTFLAVPITPTLLTYPTFGGANTDFITQLNNITAGTKSTNNTGTGILTLSLSHSPPLTTLTIVSGYVSSNSLKLETITALNQYVTGTGVVSNGIPSNINSFISAVPTAPSSQYTIRSGTGTLSATNTNSSVIEGYTRFTSPNYFFISTTQLIDNYFIQATGIPQATRTRDPIAPYVSQSKIMRLTQLNGYVPTATATSFVFTGIVANATQIKITSAPLGFSSGFMLENATTIPTSFNSLIPNGTKNTAWDSTNQIITCSGLTASTASLTNLKGYMRTTTLLEVRGLGNATARLNWFFTGSGIGANKNYVSAASSQSPYTLASTNTATTPTATGVAGFTKFRDATSFLLVLDNPTPFKFDNYLISSTALPENTGLSAGLNNAVSSNDIIVNADFSNYNLVANLTIREPTIAANPLGYKAYPTTNPSFNTYYCLQTITLGATNYINATKLDGISPGFARDLDLRGTPNANNLFTTSSVLGTPTITTGFVGAIFNGGASGYYFCSTNFANLIDNFIVGTTIAPDTRVIYNTDIFDKGSLTISKLDFRVAPTASTPVVNSSIVTSWYIRSASVAVGGGIFDTELYLRSATSRITTLANNQFFINSVTATTFNNLSLNGAYITSFTQEPTLNCFKATFRGKANILPTGQKGGDLGIFQISTLVYRIDTLGLYVPAVNDFIRIATRTNVNNIRAVSSLGSNLYDLTLEYTEGALGSGFSYVITSPVTTTASLLQTTAITAYEAHNLVVYTAGSTYSYYPETNLYSAFSPMTINVYDGIAGTPLAIQPINYTIQTPFTYNYITPLSITDYGRTTLSFYNTETITFFTFFDINLPPNQANTTLVSVDAIQTLTNKTFDRIGLQTITNQTSTQLGYTIRNTLTATTLATANTWLEPPGNTGRITLASQGVYLLSYSFSTRTIAVLMGCLSESASAPYATPQTTDGANVLCFSGSVNTNTNWISCSNTIVYINTTANRTIYLWWASNGVALIKTNGNYFQAVRIA
jgi:hypothetical protein